MATSLPNSAQQESGWKSAVCTLNNINLVNDDSNEYVESETHTQMWLFYRLKCKVLSCKYTYLLKIKQHNAYLQIISKKINFKKD